jgi:hypothetical protein
MSCDGMEELLLVLLLVRLLKGNLNPLSFEPDLPASASVSFPAGLRGIPPFQRRLKPRYPPPEELFSTPADLPFQPLLPCALVQPVTIEPLPLSTGEDIGEKGVCEGVDGSDA